MIFLSPRTDIAFKKVFGNAQHTNILINFLNNILELNPGNRIVTVVITDPNNQPETVHSKFSIVDIACTDEKNAHYIIEMQVLNRQDFIERCQYYVSVALSRQVQRGDDYIKINPVIFIGIVNFNLLESPEYFSHHKTLNIKTGEHALKHSEYHFIELPKFEKSIDQLENDCDKWVYFLKNAETLNAVPTELKKPTAMRDAFEILEQAKWTNKELDEYNRDLELQREKFVYTDTALQDGLKKGEIIGIEKGKKDGKQEKAIEIARELLDVLDVETIARKTKLTTSEVEELKKQK